MRAGRPSRCEANHPFAVGALCLTVSTVLANSRPDREQRRAWLWFAGMWLVLGSGKALR